MRGFLVTFASTVGFYKNINSFSVICAARFSCVSIVALTKNEANLQIVDEHVLVEQLNVMRTKL